MNFFDIAYTFTDSLQVGPSRWIILDIDFYNYDPITNKSAIGYAIYFQHATTEDFDTLEASFRSSGTGDMSLFTPYDDDQLMVVCASPHDAYLDDYSVFRLLDTNYQFHYENGRYVKDIADCDLLYVEHDKFGRKTLSGNYTVEMNFASKTDSSWHAVDVKVPFHINLQDRSVIKTYVDKEYTDNLTDESIYTPIIRSADYRNIDKYELLLRHFYNNDTESQVVASVELPSDYYTAYSFALSEDLRDNIRARAPNDAKTTLQYVLTTYYKDEMVHKYHGEPFTITISDCAPIINNLVIQEHKDEIYALTGNRDRFVKYISSAEFQFEPVARKHATIESITVKCGEQVITDMPQGYFDDIESGTFEITVVDSRGMATSTTVFKEMVPYVKLTCYQNIALELIEDDKVNAQVKVHGSWFYGHFGDVANELVIEFRHTQNDGSMGDWFIVTDSLFPEFNSAEQTYELSFGISGLKYMSSYDFQCRVKDKASNYVISQTNTSAIIPTYDWGKEDFNFNVPINMNEQTVLRHNKAAKNIVLSASGENIYFRPAGTDETEGEARLDKLGNLTLSGALNAGTINATEQLNITGDLVLNGEVFAKDDDYIIEHGEEAMGTNGYWIWTKWKSGRVECYGTRNMGKVSVNNVQGSLFVSNAISQPFPSGLFKSGPTIAMVYGLDIQGLFCWVMQNPSTTVYNQYGLDGITLVSPTSGITTRTYLSFYVRGY